MRNGSVEVKFAAQPDSSLEFQRTFVEAYNLSPRSSDLIIVVY